MKKLFKSTFDSFIDLLSSKLVGTICDYLWIAAGILFGLMFLVGIIITGYFLGLGFYLGLAAGVMIGTIVLWLKIDSKFYLARKEN